MIAALRMRLAVPDDAKLSKLLDEVSALIDGIESVTITSTSLAQETRTFTLHGVDTETRETFVATVQATDPDDARAQVQDGPRVVATVSEEDVVG